MKKPIKISKLNSIYTKIAGVIVVTTGLVASTITVVETWQNTKLMNQLMTGMAYSQSDMVSDLVAGGIRFGKTDQINRVLTQTAEASEGRLERAVAINAEGEVVGQYGTEVGPAVSALAKKALATGENVTSDDGFRIAIPVLFGPKQSIVGVVATSWSNEALLRDANQAIFVALATASAVFFLAVVAALYCMHRLFFNPLRRFGIAIQGMAEKSYESPVPFQTRRDEVGAFGRSLEELRADLQEGEEAQREAVYGSAAFRGTSACLMLLDADLTIQQLNPHMQALFTKHAEAIRKNLPHFNPADLIGKPIETFHPDSTPIRGALEKLGDEPFEAMLGFGEATISLKIKAIRNRNGDLTGYVQEWADVSGTLLNAAIVEAIDANQVMAQFSLSGNLLTANKKCLEALEMTEEQARSLSLSRMLSASDETGSAKNLVAGATSGQPFLGKLKMQCREGSVSVIEGSLTCVKDRSGKPTRILLMGRDVTIAEGELDTARRERRESAENQNAVVDALRIGLKQLSEGDLMAAIKEPFAGAYEDLRIDFNNTVANLADALRRVAENAENIHNEASDISSTADGLSRRTETTAATLEQTAAALDELTNSVKAAADGAAQADHAVSAAKENAEDSGRVVLDTVSAMDQIAESSGRITSIIKVIDDIAFQTNLLALNAGVEAARAGDAGRGFAVVASEVRALAQRSSDAAREINDLIAKSGTQVKTGVDLVGQTGEALQQIVESVSEISTLVSDIAASSKQQSSSLVEINNAVTQLDQSTQQNAARLEETTAASESLRNDAMGLVETVSHFRIAQSTRETGGEVKPRSQEKGSNTPAFVRSTATRKPDAGPAEPIEKAASGWEDF